MKYFGSVITVGPSLLFSTTFLVAMIFIFMPESPQYLIHKGKNVEAYVVWKRICGFDALEFKIEVLGMEQSVVADNLHKHHGFPWPVHWHECDVLYGHAYEQYQLQQQNSVFIFMSLVGSALMLGTIPVVLYMEKVGRRYWANTMLPGFFIGIGY